MLGFWGENKSAKPRFKRVLSRKVCLCEREGAAKEMNKHCPEGEEVRRVAPGHFAGGALVCGSERRRSDLCSMYHGLRLTLPEASVL